MKGRAHLIQEEVWLLDFSQGVSEEAEHEFLHLEPINSPQLLKRVGRVEAGERLQSVMGPAPLSQAPWPSPSSAIPLGTRGETAGTQEETLGRALAAPPACRREGQCLVASWLAWSIGNEGPLRRQSPASGQHSCPECSNMAPRLPLPPTCTGNHPAGNPTSPLQSKPQGSGFQEGEIHLQETEAGQGSGHMGKGLSGRKAGQRMGAGLKSRRAGERVPQSPQAGQQG